MPGPLGRYDGQILYKHGTRAFRNLYLFQDECVFFYARCLTTQLGWQMPTVTSISYDLQTVTLANAKIQGLLKGRPCIILHILSISRHFLASSLGGFRQSIERWGRRHVHYGRALPPSSSIGSVVVTAACVGRWLV